MDEATLEKRIRAGEDSSTEFKRVDAGMLPEKEDIAKSLVALANSGGGDVLYGVANDGTVSGIGSRSDSDKLQRHISQVASSITPPLPVRLSAVDISNHIVLIARVPAFLPQRPFRGTSKYFVRDGPSSREARPDELKMLLTSAPIHYFDEEAIDTAARADLDDAVVKQFLAEAYPTMRPEQTERYLDAIHGIDRNGRPTVTGIVLFAVEPRRFIVGSYVSCVRFPGVGPSQRFEDSREVSANIFQQIEETFAFISLHVPNPSTVEGLRRRQTGVPGEVWREAITNALTHRDYASANQVRVFVFDDRVEITNPGGLLNQLTVENIRLAGTKQPRNPHIAQAVARRGQRENLGLGVPEMLRLVAEQGLPEPQIKVEAGEFRLTIYTRP